MDRTIIYEIKISEQEWNFLEKLHEDGYAEFRDHDGSYQEYVESIEDVNSRLPCEIKIISEDKFKARNFHNLGTEDMISRLADKHLIDIDLDAWHTTYKLTIMGAEIVKKELSK